AGLRQRVGMGPDARSDDGKPQQRFSGLRSGFRSERASSTSLRVNSPVEGSEHVMRANRLRLAAGLCAALALPAVCTQAQHATAQGTPPAQGWAVRASLSNPSAKLYNTAKQKLLDGMQIFTYTISRLDVKLYCEVSQHYDYIWFEMQHSTMSYRDVEEMI